MKRAEKARVTKVFIRLRVAFLALFFFFLPFEILNILPRLVAVRGAIRINEIDRRVERRSTAPLRRKSKRRAFIIDRFLETTWKPQG
jgi:hypothetical protein